MRIVGALLFAALLTGCSAGSGTSNAEVAGSDPEPTSDSADLVLGKDPLPPSITERQYVDLMGQLGFAEDELTLWRVAAEGNCQKRTTAAEYAATLAAARDNIYDADPVMIEGLGVRRYCEGNLAPFSGGAAVFQTVRDNLVEHCAIPEVERVAALGPDYYPFTAIMCANA
jgi:hypothetical protein